ncbi:hypothetical protein ABIA69_004736 [Lysinibacillus parviboronicapiens]|uniref:Uncharacterized protein n=1 Tax=Lysinibacillus parviboronicapiens TaxID=436516 RepID=A0ABV2PRF7_9BACI
MIKSKSEQSVDTATKLDINSKEGWNAFAMEGNIKTFTKEFGREPDSFEEVLTYITETIARVVAADKASNQEEANQTSNVVTHEEEIQNVCRVHNN